MKLNYECIRAVLIQLEEDLQLDEEFHAPTVSFERLCEELSEFGYEKTEIGYTVLKLNEAGYINARVYKADNKMEPLLCEAITFSGHEYLNAVRDHEMWRKIKEYLKKKSVEITVQSVLLVAKEVIQAQLLAP